MSLSCEVDIDVVRMLRTFQEKEEKEIITGLTFLFQKDYILMRCEVKR